MQRGGKFMARLTEGEILAQVEEARKAQVAFEPKIAGARYDAGKVIIDLQNGATFILPTSLIEGLQDAPEEGLKAVEVLELRDALEWPALDVQVGIGGLMAGIFGSRKWMAELGRAGGSRTSAAKAAAVRENGKKGGRPRKLKAE